MKDKIKCPGCGNVYSTHNADGDLQMECPQCRRWPELDDEKDMFIHDSMDNISKELRKIRRLLQKKNGK
jgi:phage FluMu protein Com